MTEWYSDTDVLVLPVNLDPEQQFERYEKTDEEKITMVSAPTLSNFERWSGLKRAFLRDVHAVFLLHCAHTGGDDPAKAFKELSKGLPRCRSKSYACVDLLDQSSYDVAAQHIVSLLSRRSSTSSKRKREPQQGQQEKQILKGNEESDDDHYQEESYGDYLTSKIKKENLSPSSSSLSPFPDFSSYTGMMTRGRAKRLSNPVKDLDSSSPSLISRLRDVVM